MLGLWSGHALLLNLSLCALDKTPLTLSVFCSTDTPPPLLYINLQSFKGYTCIKPVYLSSHNLSIVLSLALYIYLQYLTIRTVLNMALLSLNLSRAISLSLSRSISRYLHFSLFLSLSVSISTPFTSPLLFSPFTYKL